MSNAEAVTTAGMQSGRGEIGLESMSLFEGLSPEAIRDIEGLANWRRFEPDQQVFDKESDTLEVYFVVEGAVRILSPIQDDREVTLAEVLAGNFFGELSAIDGKKRSARVVAVRDSLLASIEGPVFVEVMKRHPIIALRVLDRLARIIRSLDSRVTNLSTLTENQRVVVELIRLAEPDPKVPNAWHIPDMPNHVEIANWAGTARELVAQTIGELARDGVVKRKSMGLVICDWSRLQLMAKSAHPRG